MGKKQCPAEFAELLGLISDATLATVAGTSPGIVRRWRRERGVSRFNEVARRVWLEPAVEEVLDAGASELSACRALARMGINCTPDDVRIQRRLRSLAMKETT